VHAQPTKAPRRSLTYVTSRFPYPPIGGDKLRVFHMVRLLAREFDVDVIALGAVDASETAKFCAATGARSAVAVRQPKLRALWGAGRALLSGAPLQAGYFRSAALDAAVARSVASSDAIVCHLIRSSAAWRKQRRIPAVLDLCDAISSNYAQVVDTASALKLWTWVSRIEGPRVARFEQEEIERFDVLTLVSSADAQRLQVPADKTLLLTQGVELDAFEFVPPAQRQGHCLALIGKMDTFPNRNGALWFAREVLPHLPATMRLKVIGHCPPGLRQAFEQFDRVDVTGRVPDIAGACADCFAAVAPLEVATGIQNKVLEYFAMGLPTVMSSSVARGLLPQAEGTHLVANGAAEWIETLKQLGTHPGRAHAMAVKARAYVKEHHDWDQIGALFVRRIQATLAAQAA
jgi:glycosyltransferase involved in cell wall biosynthesis